MAENPLTAAQRSPTGFGGWFLDGDFTGYAAVGNFRTNVIEPPPLGSATTLATRLSTASGECPGCPNDCVKRYDNGVDERLGGLDEEGLAALVLGCGVTDIDLALTLHARCLALGLDPVSLAGVVAFLRERTPDGDENLAALIEKIARRAPGFWRLGEGVRRLADARGAAESAMHVKGLEMPRYDPRASAGQALAYAVSPLGPRYEIVEHDIDFDPVDGPPHGLDQMATLGTYDWEPMARLDARRVARTVTLMELWSGLDALCVCLFAGPPMRELTQHTVAALVHAVTGWVTSDQELFLWGRRRLQLMRLYNQREGIGRDEDTLPARFFTDPVDAGRHRGAVLDRAVFTESVGRYYMLMGWDAHGMPTADTLLSLGLDWATTQRSR
jgi:aldehyde:ferredoxin oxidoreductase